MNKPIRRTDRILDQEQATALIQESEYGFLSTVSQDGTPYCVPLSYAYDGDNLYFHCAQEGHKLENIKHNNQVCFTIAGHTEVLQEKFTTKYKSAILFGKAYEILDPEEKSKALYRICEKYTPDALDKLPAMLTKALDATCIIKIEVERFTAKGNV